MRAIVLSAGSVAGRDTMAALLTSRNITENTGDLFGDRSTDKQRADRIEIARRLADIRGGAADVSDLPLFSAQTDLFDKGV